MSLGSADDREKVPPAVSDAEWDARVQLAACYRLVAKFGWDELIWSHISTIVPGPEKHILLNPYGVVFDQVTASSLVKLDLDGNIVGDSEHKLNPAGAVLHTPFYKHRDDVGCVLHLETDAGTGVSCQEDGLLPITQTALSLSNTIAYHAYEGFSLDFDECERLIADAGDKWVIFLRNHGTIVLGRTVASAFHMTFLVEQACRAQIAAQAGGAKLIFPPQEIVQHAAQQQATEIEEGDMGWPSLIEALDRQDPSYRD